MNVLSREYYIECFGRDDVRRLIFLSSLDLRYLDNVKFSEECVRYQFVVMRNVPALTGDWIARTILTYLGYCERNDEETVGEAIRGDNNVRELFLKMWGV